MRKRLISIIFVSFLLIISYSLSESVSERSEGSPKLFNPIRPLSETGSWLFNWTHRKAHSISGSTCGVQVNYPIMVNVHYDGGFDIEGDVYLNGKCRTDFGDIRFTDAIGNNLNYWIQQKVDGIQALIWVELQYIPASPAFATIYLYYGNANATTTSNQDWTFPFASDFEDGTNQGWIISFSTHINFDGVESTTVFQGNYSRYANRQYGSYAAGQGHFYESFTYTSGVYISSGTYWLQAAAKFYRKDAYVQPQRIDLQRDGISIAHVDNPQDSWHAFGGNFTLSVGQWILPSIQFHLFTTSGLANGDEGYYIDSILLRKWCDPEPTHGSWGSEETSDDSTPPVVYSVTMTPLAPHPYVPLATPRPGEPVVIRANVSDEVDGSGIRSVVLHCKANNTEWWNTSMTFNATASLWTTVILGHDANSTVTLFITATDNAGNHNTSSLYNYSVTWLIQGDINGDGKVDIKDIAMAAINFGKSRPDI